MTRFEAWLVHLANLLVGGTGLAYAWLRYFATPVDELSLVHPWQGTAQHAHVLAAPLLVFALGVIWRSHVWAGFRLGSPARRRSGVTMLALAAPMIASGYLLQVAVEPGWRQAWIAVHVAASVLWLVGTLAHQLTPRPRSAEPRAPSAPVTSERTRCIPAREDGWGGDARE
jgi:hypothetical protein